MPSKGHLHLETEEHIKFLVKTKFSVLVDETQIGLHLQSMPHHVLGQSKGVHALRVAIRGQTRFFWSDGGVAESRLHVIFEQIAELNIDPFTSVVIAQKSCLRIQYCDPRASGIRRK